MLNIHMGTELPEPEKGTVVFECPTRAFASGAEGYFAGGKVVIDGALYQVSCNVIRIGSNLESGAAERAAKVAADKAAKEEAKARKQAARTSAE